MRASLVAVVALSTIVAPILSVRADEIPTLNIEPLCRGIVSQGSDPGAGSEPKLAFQNCMEAERADHARLKKEWSTFSSDDKRHCVALSVMDGGESSYSELITCLEMARDVKKLTSRSASRTDVIAIAAPELQPDPNLDAADQLSPSQMTQSMPVVAEPSGAPSRKLPPPEMHAATNAMTGPRAEAATPSRPAAFPVVACSGPFALDSDNLSLAVAFDSKNVVFAEVDGGPIGKVPASILFPNNSKRRLEVWWSDQASRTRIYLIVINGQSGWTAPLGLRLGLTLAETEKLNRKPFKLTGFDTKNVASVSDWDGGALAALPGGCKAGVNLHSDPKAPVKAVTALSADHEFSSADAVMRAIKPTVSEILIGY
jgi:hypothetical protein